jgi:putrescine transport system permease protein
MFSRKIWPLFAAPGLLWLILLFLVPFYAVVSVAFGGVDPIFQTPVPSWNPINWNFGTFMSTLSGFLPGQVYWSVFTRTATYVALALTGSLLIGFPVAYYVSRHANRSKKILLLLLMMPFWVSYMMRMLAWVNILSPNGMLDKILTLTHLWAHPPNWLGGSAVSVVLALIYGYVPYMILPLLAAVDRLDRSVLEAARDLGATPLQAFRLITLPLCRHGLLGASAIIVMPMFGDYYTPSMISDSPQTSMLGNQIDIFFQGGPQPDVGAALTLILSAFLAVLMIYYMRSITRAQRELQE